MRSYLAKYERCCDDMGLLHDMETQIVVLRAVGAPLPSHIKCDHAGGDAGHLMHRHKSSILLQRHHDIELWWKCAVSQGLHLHLHAFCECFLG